MFVTSHVNMWMELVAEWDAMEIDRNFIVYDPSLCNHGVSPNRLPITLPRKIEYSHNSELM